MKRVIQIYSGRRSEMLTAALVIAKHGLEDHLAFEKMITIWDASYFLSYEQRILEALDLLGENSAEVQMEASEAVFSMFDDAMGDLSVFRDVVLSVYEDVDAAKDVLKRLGFGFLGDARDGDQETLVELLEVFVSGLSRDLESELLSLGLSATMFANIRRYKRDFALLNVAQEVEKERSVERTAVRQLELNSIYRQMMGICRIGKQLARKGLVVRDRYVYARILGRLKGE